MVVVPEPVETLHDAVLLAERTCLLRAMAWRVSRPAMARRLGVSTRTLFYKLRKHGFTTPAETPPACE